MRLISAIFIFCLARNTAASSTLHDEYKFSASECDQGKFLDTGADGYLSYLQAPASSGSPTCLLTDGVSSQVKLRSHSTVSALSAHSTTELTLEMWLEPNNNLSGDAPFISFGKDGVQSDGCTNNLVVR
jgi:hypothetical protein